MHGRYYMEVGPRMPLLVCTDGGKESTCWSRLELMRRRSEGGSGGGTASSTAKQWVERGAVEAR